MHIVINGTLTLEIQWSTPKIWIEENFNTKKYLSTQEKTGKGEQTEKETNREEI